MYEIPCPEWLTNVVMVKKSNGKWRIIYYTDVNKACPKNYYPPPTIDQLIEVTVGHLMLSFMNAFSGYNQVPMILEDQPKTEFINHMMVYTYF